MKKINLTGQRFGRLIVTGPAPHIGKKVAWCCLCECGHTLEVTTSNLRDGHTTSCGCSHVLHGQSYHSEGKTRIYRIWDNMKQRCKNPKAKWYKNYGGRGISVCPEWDKSFIAFYTWAMAHGYEDGLQIDRINNDGDYTPDNCRWVTKAENLNNTRQCVYIDFNGKRHTVAEWSRITGIPRSTIRGRLRAGKTPEEIFEGK